MPPSSDPSPAPPDQNVDLILQQIGSLPTLSSVAVRVMSTAGKGDADLSEISALISSDPSLASKVLALCRRADLGLGRKITTIDRAVVMLGLEAVRAALLSVEIHEVFRGALEHHDAGRRRRASDAPVERAFDRRELWRHCIAVGCAAELLAEAFPESVGGFTPQEAFLAGLLHDLGKIALDALLPRSYERVASIARERGLSIAEVERRVLGIDHHTAGKRLAEHWGLPHALLDVMWLHGQPASLLPDVPHRALITAVAVADAEVRRMHLGWSGNWSAVESVEQSAGWLGVEPSRLNAVTLALPERVAQRCTDLGLDETSPSGLLLDCLARANSLLGSVSARLDQQARRAQRSEAVLARIAEFLSSDEGGGNQAEAMASVLRQAREVLAAPAVLVVQTRDGAPWTVYRLSPDGRGLSHTRIDPPGKASLGRLCDPSRHGGAMASALAWLVDWVKGERWQESPTPLVLAGERGGFAAVLLHGGGGTDQPVDPAGLSTLARVWGSALASAFRHAGARRLGEQLADANRRLAESQARLVEQRSLVRLGEMAAGAAHEMNNPLAVISGHAQLLARSLREPGQASSAASIVQATQRLTELISSLHLFADPPKPVRRATDIAELLQKSVRIATQRFLGRGKNEAAHLRTDAQVSIVCDPTLPLASLDRKQIVLALTELIVNALQAKPKRNVEVRARVDPFDGRLIIEVVDDGEGMSQRALEHAFDPFFSELPAGRRTGLGLTRARRFVDLHGGSLTLSSEPGKGTTARIVLSDWRAVPSEGAVSEAA